MGLLSTPQRLFVEHARGRKPQVEVAEQTTAERLVVVAHDMLGDHRADDDGFITTPTDGEREATPADGGSRARQQALAIVIRKLRVEWSPAAND